MSDACAVHIDINLDDHNDEHGSDDYDGDGDDHRTDVPGDLSGTRCSKHRVHSRRAAERVVWLL